MLDTQSRANDAFGDEIWPNDPVLAACEAAQELFLKKKEGAQPGDPPTRSHTADINGFCYTEEDAPKGIGGSARLSVPAESETLPVAKDEFGYNEGPYSDGKYGS